ncbi:type II secretion system F family protein [Lutibaculum baratangense]|uniref:Flp pilus assembly protein TadB n=1 Tax=Lutibaculum baratangense AMV1 TaxID=631454 RepID=V4RHJ2_9HYPH|nr:type II secretion system F family protein [Lutibaculum baratangense]ESR24819.1 Flp pilus assembly protein TadB [Lutibaculum baratangense AMV1]
MLGATATALAMAFMAAVAVGGLAWVFLGPLLSGQSPAEKRVKALTRHQGNALTSSVRNELADMQKRRKQLADTLKEIETKNKKRKRPPLRARLAQAGLSWEINTFVIVSFVFAAVGGFVAYAVGAPLLVVLGVVLAAGLGAPQWLVNYLIARRTKKFLNEFANAIDVIVRGVKAGLPLADCIRVVAAEAQEPVRTEFRRVIESQGVGLPLAEAVERMYERMPLPEVNFFVIVVAIQQKAGGNLSEALGNLSKVLRDRRKMRQKIIAMSQEAKASAAIIGALPVVVMLLVFLTSPEYISLLWQEQLGHIMLVASAFWMLCGILVMRKMINFDF